MAGAGLPEETELPHLSPVTHSLPARRLPLARLILEKGMLVDKSSGSRGLAVQLARGLLTDLGPERKHPQALHGPINSPLSGREASSPPSLCDRWPLLEDIAVAPCFLAGLCCRQEVVKAYTYQGPQVLAS